MKERLFFLVSVGFFVWVGFWGFFLCVCACVCVCVCVSVISLVKTRHCRDVLKKNCDSHKMCFGSYIIHSAGEG